MVDKKALRALLLSLKSKGEEPKKLLQVIKGWNEKGTVLMPGSRVKVDASKARKIIGTGYACEVDEDAPYSYPCDKKEHSFQRVEMKDTSHDADMAGDLHDMPYLNEGMVSALKGAGIYCIAEIEHYTVDTLRAIPGIGRATAEKLIASYKAEYGDYGKEDGMQVECK